jgi:ubiquinone/menaquinone biosynthesis C-methylase UbiE
MELQQRVVFPAVIRLLWLEKHDKLLDAACGQGAFCREALKRTDLIVGLDASRRLIELARKITPAKVKLHVGDARAFPEEVRRAAPYDAVSCILALGNIDDAAKVFEESAKILKTQGRLVFVITHPCFRIPRQSGWGWDEKRKLQYRRIDKYASEMKIPITMHPGQGRSEVTWTFHRPLHYYFNALRSAGFMVDAVEELVTHRHSTPGPRAKADQTSKEEIPLFMAIRAVKLEARSTKF